VPFLKGHSPRLVAGSCLLAAIVVLGILAGPLSHHDPTSLDTSHKFQSPSGQWLMGTDQLGMDILSRTLYAIRLDLPLGLAAVALSATVGITLGMVAALGGRGIDALLGRLTDGFQAFPPLVLALLTATALGASLTNLVVIIALVYVPVFARMTRAQVLVLRQHTFVEVARSLRYGWVRIALVHLLPNAAGPLLATAALAIGRSVVLAAGLGFLGLGPPPPTPEWGAMIGAGAEEMAAGRWWIAVFPGCLLALTVAAFALIADGIQQNSDARIR
jgi:peptide/nickel transport system permease protein